MTDEDDDAEETALAVTAAAELQAKRTLEDLARKGVQAIAVGTTIGTRSQAQWTKLGFKKFDTVLVKGKNRNESVAVRFDKDQGMFGAELEGVIFQGRDLKSVTAAMAAHLQTIESYVFARYIQVDYDRTHESERGRHGNKSWSSTRDSRRPVSGIKLEFDVYDVTDAFETSTHGGSSKARVWRRLFFDELLGDWNVENEDTVHVYSNIDEMKGLMAFTTERYQALVAIKDALTTLDARLSAMFGDEVKDQGAMLDALDTRLLGGGE